jgi:hypothetical protein
MGLIYSYYDPYYYYYPSYYSPYVNLYGVYPYPRGYTIIGEPTAADLRRYSNADISGRVVSKMPIEDLDELEAALKKSNKANADVIRLVERVKRKREFDVSVVSVAALQEQML